MVKTKLREHQVVAFVVSYLINKGFDITHISVKNKHINNVKNIIKNKTKRKIDDGIFNKNKYDIRVKKWGREKREIIEAKGGNVKYGIYTGIGQIICERKKESDYWWQGFACPATWKPYIKKRLTNEEDKSIKPMIKLLIEKFTRHEQGLYFYFVKEDGSVEQRAWNKFLKK